MEKAKSAVSSFLHKDGKDNTTVHESTNAAVQNENVTRTQHNESQTAIDREVHQDHYHTTVQPIQDREVLPEKHTHQMAPVEHRTIEHGNEHHTKKRLEEESAKFQNTRHVGDVQHTHGSAATLGGEHVHHHVHENIQPVIQKETVQPTVVHTTKPIHEVHYNEAKHHGTSTLPTVSLAEFQKNGHGGTEPRHDAFAGAPNHDNGHPIGGTGAHGTTSVTEKDASHAQHGHGTGAGLGNTSTTSTSHKSVGAASTGHNTIGPNSTGYNTTGNNITGHATTATQKPSLLSRLNPMKDADGDGKKGFMD